MLNPDQMLELMELVENQGGEQAAGRCQPSKFSLKMEGPDGVRRAKDFLTTGCGHESRFLIPYSKPDEALGGNAVAALGGNAVSKGSEGTAVVCAHDDRMDLWPRFNKEL